MVTDPTRSDQVQWEARTWAQGQEVTGQGVWAPAVDREGQVLTNLVGTDNSLGDTVLVRLDLISSQNFFR